MNNFGVRIKEARLERGLTRKQLAELTDTAEKTIYNYETNKVPITMEFLIMAAEQLGVSYNYLAHLDDLSISDVHKSISKSKNLSISNVLKPKKMSITPPNQLQTLNDDIVSIPFYEDIRASAGSGAYNEAETAEQLNFPKSFLRQYFGLISFNNLSIIIGKGDSMSPTLPESCYLLVQNGSVNDGEICIARLDDELYVKRLQKRPKLKLFSDNKNYEPIELEGENFEILGRVVGYFKKTAL